MSYRTFRQFVSIAMWHPTSEEKGIPSGLNLRQKRLIARPLKGDNFCRFRFVMGVDAKGFYGNACVGNARYNGHIHDGRVSTKLPRRLLNNYENSSSSTDSTLSCPDSHNP